MGGLGAASCELSGVPLLIVNFICAAKERNCLVQKVLKVEWRSIDIDKFQGVNINLF